MLYQGLLDEIVEQSRQIFGEELIGIYLHGSMAMGCFHADKSDIDLIFVIRDRITDTQKLRFMNCIIDLNKTAPSKGIELSIVSILYIRHRLNCIFRMHINSGLQTIRQTIFKK